MTKTYLQSIFTFVFAFWPQLLAVWRKVFDFGQDKVCNLFSILGGGCMTPFSNNLMCEKSSQWAISQILGDMSPPPTGSPPMGQDDIVMCLENF